MTRKEYMDASSAASDRAAAYAVHRAYFAQFATPEVRRAVHHLVERVKASSDPHLNDIPLAVWDRLAGGSGRAHLGDSAIHHRPHFMPYSALKEAGEGYSLGTAVCVLKEAARLEAGA